jgi:hypothetical protein
MFIQKEKIRCVTAQKEDACSDYQPREYYTTPITNAIDI